MVNINEGVQKYQDTAGAVLIDVRDEDEFAQGHIPDSVNVPLGDLAVDICGTVPNVSTPVFLYCRSGRRSGRASVILAELGYADVTDIGGILSYRGELEK